MLEPWELILHHSYSGTPGVAFDHSPGHTSHGRSVDLGADDFLLDGQSDGSGSVRFGRRKRISVLPTGKWDRLQAIGAEVVFKRETADTGGHLLNADRSFYARVGATELSFGVYTEWHLPGSFLGSYSFSVNFADFDIDPRSWIRAGLTYDGLNTAQVYLNGELARTFSQYPLTPVRPSKEVTIGNERLGSLPFDGLIDDVKVWRPNPHRMTHDFLVRILDDGVTDCWVDWGAAFRRALDDLARSDVECPGTVVRLLDRVLAVLGSVLVHSDTTRQALDDVAAEYRRCWARGDIAAAGPALARFLEVLRAEGVPLEQVTEVGELLDNRCLRDLFSSIPSLDCDPNFSRMLGTGDA